MTAEQKIDISNWDALIEAALEIGHARKQIEKQMRSALEREDNEEVIRLAKALCGLEADYETRN